MLASPSRTKKKYDLREISCTQIFKWLNQNTNTATISPSNVNTYFQPKTVCQLPNIPRPATMAEIILLGGLLHVIGGAVSLASQSPSFREVLMLRPNRTWEMKAGMLNEARHRFSVCFYTSWILNGLTHCHSSWTFTKIWFCSEKKKPSNTTNHVQHSTVTIPKHSLI